MSLSTSEMLSLDPRQGRRGQDQDEVMAEVERRVQAFGEQWSQHAVEHTNRQVEALRESLQAPISNLEEKMASMFQSLRDELTQERGTRRRPAAGGGGGGGAPATDATT